MVINQGDIFWIEFDEPAGSGPGYKHPHVVIQNNIFNKSRINTTVVCALTSTLRRANAPGNVLLEIGEGNLSKQSVVNISQVFTVDKQELGEYIGTLSRGRVQQILQGLDLLFHSRDVE
ncbi:MAG: type II toxin-antitoxin system PemK/MazF family toxin [Herpetosiphonaceae bacterium]|nr:type II toxin-antitoxin system PemK/MazF family toxin [Herpetosiphonaceae bacterium]